MEMKISYYKAVVLILVIAFLIASGSAIYFYIQFGGFKSNPREEIEKVVERVGRHIVLPEGETPTVATVTDPEKLKDQVFFQKAKAGDKVLIYTNAKKAILYDPELDKIIEFAPLNIGNQ